MPFGRSFLVICLIYSSVYMSVPAFQFIPPLSYKFIFYICNSYGFGNSYSNRVKCYLVVFLIFISWLISDIEQLFLYLSDIWISSLQKYLFRPIAKFLIESFVSLCVFCCWVIWVPYIFWILTTWSDSGLQIFFLFYSCHFILLMVSLLHRVF